jgi:hypothetical protein
MRDDSHELCWHGDLDECQGDLHDRDRQWLHWYAGLNDY